MAEQREWWMWLLHSGSESVVRARIGTLKLSVPYVWDPESLPEKDRRWGLIGLMTMHKRAERRMNEAFADYFRQWFSQWHDLGAHEQQPHIGLMGRMIRFTMSTWYRGSRQVLFTPPIYKFCDLNKEFTELDDVSRFEVLPPPYDFWVQPETLQAAGEVLQGPPTSEDNVKGYPHRSHVLSAMIAELPDYRPMFEFIHVALDAWIENFERTGETTADPRFAFTWAEERARRYGEEGAAS